jgi:hypothetical protein
MPVITDHNGYQIEADQTLPLFIFGLLSIIFIFSTELFTKILRKLGILETPQEDEVDE